MAGGIAAGHLSDRTGASALVSTGFTLCAVPALYLYRSYGHLSFSLNVGLMMLSGFVVNGPYALITTAVSADLGAHESLAGNAKALATARPPPRPAAAAAAALALAPLNPSTLSTPLPPPTLP